MGEAQAQAQGAQPAVEVKSSEEEIARQAMGKLLMEILGIAGELAIELADIDDPKIMELGLYKTAKRLVKKLKELKELVERHEARKR